jgi:hypothetical protein
MTRAADEEIVVPSVAELTVQYSAGTLLQSLFGPYARSWGREDEMVRAIADAHNAGAINILSILSQESLAEIGQFGFFGGQQLYCKTIPLLDATTQEMVEAVFALIEKGGTDGAAGFPANALEDWCRAENTRPTAMLQLIDSGDARAARFLPLTLYAGSYVDRAAFLARAHEAASSGSADLRRGAIGALGRIDPQTDDEWSNLMATLGNVISEDDDDLTAGALGAIRIRIGAEAGNRREALEKLIIESTDRALGPQALHRFAEMLWLEVSKLSEPTKAAILSALQNVDAGNRGTIDLIDHALEQLVKGGRASEAREFLEALLVRHEDVVKLKHFDSTCHAITAAEPEVWHDWIVDWLLKGQFALCSQIASPLGGGELEGARFDINFTRYDLGEGDHTYLAKKAIGFLFLKQLSAASIILSLARSAPKNIVQELEDLLFDPMLLNYSGITRDLLEPVSKDRSDPARALAKRTIDRLTKYLDDLASVETLRELRPSERQRQLEWERHSDSMAEAKRGADQKSIFAEIFTKVVVLHGNRSVSYHSMGDETPKRFETKMASHGISMEIPRVDIVDPLGLQRMLFAYRAEKRPS